MWSLFTRLSALLPTGQQVHCGIRCRHRQMHTRRRTVEALLISTVDRVVSRTGLLSSMVNRTAGRLIPEVEAGAWSCGWNGTSCVQGCMSCQCGEWCFGANCNYNCFSWSVSDCQAGIFNG